MRTLGIEPRREEKSGRISSGPLAGALCVLTGTLSRPRSEYAELIEAVGGTVQSAVSSKTRYLVAGANVGAAKTAKARAFGTEVIGEEELLRLLGGGDAGGSGDGERKGELKQDSLF
jgi:NAD-dependent DNA ligase